MSIRKIYVTFGFLFVYTICISQKVDRPNVIIILADDLGYGDLSCYNPGMTFKTSNIDALAKKGLRFTDAHSPSSVCTPTRYGLLTGRYAWRGTLKKGVLLPWDQPLIEKARLTLPDMLKQTGYATYAVGKWHLGWNWQKVDKNTPIDKFGNNVDFKQPVTGGPIDYGFDYYFGDDVPNYPPYTFFENDHLLAIPTQMKPDSIYGNPGIMTPGWSLEKVIPTITRKAVEVIGKAAGDKKQPFLLYFALTGPHTPIAPSPDFKGKSGMGPYGDYLLEIDWSVGQIIKAVEAQHLSDNTLIIFTSDNGSPALDGEKMGGIPGSLITKYHHNTNLNLRGLKGDLWEGGHRVPLIVSYGKKTASGKTTSNPVLLLDIMATIAEMVGQKPGPAAMEDSKSFLQTLVNPASPVNTDRPLVHHSLSGDFGIRKGDWKLILSNKSGGFSDGINKNGYGITSQGQLYNLRRDVGEKVNLYESEPKKVEELSLLLEKIKSH
jgi:arylsulfatase A